MENKYQNALDKLTASAQSYIADTTDNPEDYEEIQKYNNILQELIDKQKNNNLPDTKEFTAFKNFCRQSLVSADIARGFLTEYAQNLEYNFNKSILAHELFRFTTTIRTFINRSLDYYKEFKQSIPLILKTLNKEEISTHSLTIALDIHDYFCYKINELQHISENVKSDLKRKSDILKEKIVQIKFAK